jgi:hypothetical protein
MVAYDEHVGDGEKSDKGDTIMHGPNHLYVCRAIGGDGKLLRQEEWRTPNLIKWVKRKFEVSLQTKPFYNDVMEIFIEDCGVEK